MNEYTVNIPINDYDNLRLCELMLKKSYTAELVKRATLLASLNIDRCEYSEFIKAQNSLMAIINSNFFEFKEYENQRNPKRENR